MALKTQFLNKRPLAAAANIAMYEDVRLSWVVDREE